MTAPVLAYIAVGANLGEAQAAVRAACLALDRLDATRLVATSSLYRTAAIDASGPDYINAVAAVTTALPALALLDLLQGLENAAGRERPYRNAPRLLDLDILLYGHETIADSRLTVPHPRMVQRAFVLRPLHEIAPQWVSQEQLLAVADQAVVRVAQPPTAMCMRGVGTA